MYQQASRHVGYYLLISLAFAIPGFAAVARSSQVKPKPAKPGTPRTSSNSKQSKAAPVKSSSKLVASKSAVPAPRRSRGRVVPVYRGPWREPSFANSTTSDNVDGEDLV